MLSKDNGENTSLVLGQNSHVIHSHEEEKEIFPRETGRERQEEPCRGSRSELVSWQQTGRLPLAEASKTGTVSHAVLKPRS